MSINQTSYRSQPYNHLELGTYKRSQVDQLGHQLLTDRSELTEPWIRRLVLKKIPPHGLTIKDIQEPERKKFKETMEKLEYL